MTVPRSSQNLGMFTHIDQIHRKLKGVHQNVNALTHFWKETTLSGISYLSAQESSLGSQTINAWWSQTESPHTGICSARQMGCVCRVRAPLDCRDHAAKGSSPISFLLCLSTPNPLSDWHILSLDMLIWSIKLLKSPCTLCFWGGKHFVSKMPFEYVLSHPLCIDFYSWMLRV